MKINRSGFTLVELLIVIALIAILSVAVLATINPIEQTNKARDAKFKNDTAEVLGAFERYYASQNMYPWNNGVGNTVAFGTAYATGSTDPAFGVLGIGGSLGVLITTSELKSSFAGKEPFTATAANNVDKMYVYHNGLDSNYVCFIPKATANRYSGSNPNPNLKCLDLATPALLNLNSGTCAAGNWAVASLVPSATVANMICVPEGTIQ